ncbi:unnamed protein product [Closterium sp. NIES-64]|nr:unnamed protein product [Closterium sp. NIES-64]
MPIFSLHPSPHHPPSPLFPNPLPHPSPSPLSPNPLPHTYPPSLSPTRLPQRPLPTRLPCPAFPHLSPTLHTPHPHPSPPRLSPNTSLNLFPNPFPQTSRPTRSPTPFPHASRLCLPSTLPSNTSPSHALATRLSPTVFLPHALILLGGASWRGGSQQSWSTPPTQQELADETAAEQSTSRALGRYGVKLSPPYLLPVPLDCHGPATRFQSLMLPCVHCENKGGVGWRQGSAGEMADKGACVGGYSIMVGGKGGERKGGG